MEYLEKDEVQKFFAHIDVWSLLGQQDGALLRMLCNTGLRVQELVDLDVNHLRFSRPYTVRIHGKGKERTCPLWSSLQHLPPSRAAGALSISTHVGRLLPVLIIFLSRMSRILVDNSPCKTPSPLRE